MVRIYYTLDLEFKLIASIYFRMIQQPRFPKMTKNHVHQFYHACIYSVEETKKAFHRYVEVRTFSPISRQMFQFIHSNS